LRAEAAKSGRSVPEEVEARIEGSFTSPAIAALQDKLDALREEIFDKMVDVVNKAVVRIAEHEQRLEEIEATAAKHIAEHRVRLAEIEAALRARRRERQ
jgi:hypothetical protein